MSFIDIFKTNCKRATYLHEKVKEGKISMTEKLGMMVHMAYCRLCRRFIYQVEKIEAFGKTLSKKEATLDPNVKMAMKKAFAEELKK